MRQDRRGSWYLLTGAVVGVMMGLLYSWVINPVEYVDAPPYSLRADYKDEYRAMVAAAYLYSGDLVRAEDRLAQLKDDNPAQAVAMQAQRALANGRPEGEIRALSILAMALGQGILPESSGGASIDGGDGGFTPTPVILPATPSPIVPSLASPTQVSESQAPATSTSTPVITLTPTPTQAMSFTLQENKLVCNPNQAEPLIQVVLMDSAGQQLAGIEVVIRWDGGEDHFITGLKPELGLGYGDFVMTPKVVYSLQVAGSGQTIDDLIAADCIMEDNTHYWGSWLLTFIQP